MKKSILIAILISLIYLSIISISVLSREDSGFLVTDLNEYHEYSESMGLDMDDLNTSQRKTIYEDQYVYLKDLNKSDYIMPSTNQLLYSRDWSVRVDRNIEAPITPTGKLFMKDNDYIIILKFEMDYSYNTDPLDIGYIDIRNSNNFLVSSHNTISYVNNNEEYILSESHGLIEDSNKALIKQNSESIAKIIYPKLIYTYYLEFTPSSDNNLTSDMYFECDLDFYITTSLNENTIIIGFNEFSSNDGYYNFTATRISTYYDGGEE